MDELKKYYPDIRKTLLDALPEYWGELKSVINHIIEGPMMPEAILPLAACQASGGNASMAVPVAAAGVALGTSIRILDDLLDKDRERELWNLVGDKRAWNYSSAFNTISYRILQNANLPPDKYTSIKDAFIESSLLIGAGQDRDLTHRPTSMDDYLITAGLKTAQAFQLACKVGAMVATDDESLIKNCENYGKHLGMVIQTFNDLESIWHKPGLNDLTLGKITLPLLFGLEMDHPEQEELRAIIDANQMSIKSQRVREILDNIDTRGFLIWTALKERDEALKWIEKCPNERGKDVLHSYITGIFGDINVLFEKELSV